MIIFTLSFIQNPYVHLLKNWPLLTQVSLETYQKRAFTETRFLLGFSVYGASGAGALKYSWPSALVRELLDSCRAVCAWVSYFCASGSAYEIDHDTERTCHESPKRKTRRIHSSDPEGGPERRLSETLVLFLSSSSSSQAVTFLAFLLDVFWGQFAAPEIRDSFLERVPTIDTLRALPDLLFIRIFSK